MAVDICAPYDLAWLRVLALGVSLTVPSRRKPHTHTRARVRTRRGHVGEGGDLGTGPGLKFYGVGARPMASPRLTWDSPFSIIKPQVPEASMTLKSFQNHWFYNAKLIEA